MPKEKDTNGAVAQRTRKIVKQGKTERDLVRRARKEKESIAQCTSHTLHTIAFKAKKGMDVYFNEFGVTGDEDYVKMFNDVWKCYCLIKKTIDGEVLKIHPVKDIGLSLSNSMYYVIDSLNKLLPDGVYFNIGKIETQYTVVLYQQCSWTEGWYCFAVRDVLYKLRDIDMKLYNVFLRFLFSLSRSIHLPFWFDNFMGSTIEHMASMTDDARSQISTPEEQKEFEEDYSKWVEALNQYCFGPPAGFRDELINGLYFSTPDKIRSLLADINSDEPIVQLIKDGCSLMEKDFSIGNYDYNPDADDWMGDDDFYGLRWRDQHNIIYAWDTVTDEHETSLNDFSNEGALDPVAWLEISPNDKDVDLAKFLQMETLLSEYKAFITNANEIIKQYEQTNSGDNGGL